MRFFLTYRLVLIAAFIAVQFTPHMDAAFAQAPVSAVDATRPMLVTQLPQNVSEAQLEEDLEALQSAELEDADRATIDESLRRAITRLQNAKTFETSAIGFVQNTENHTNIMADLEAQLEQARKALDAPIAEQDMEITSDSLTRMEQDLRSLDADKSALEIQIETTQQRLNALTGREQIARAEKLASETALSEINAQIALFAGQADTLTGQANRKTLYARRYARERERNALDKEILNIPLSQAQLNVVLQIARTQNLRLSDRIEALRDKTGLLRTQEAEALIVNAQADRILVLERHPLLLKLADENLAYAQIIKTIAQSGDNTSVLQARITESTQQVREDSLLAEQIANEGNIDRKYGAVLRRLRENIPNERQIKTEIALRTQTKLDVSMERILAQDKLKDFNIGRLNIDAVFASWFISNPDASALGEDDQETLRALYGTQRNLVNEIIDSAGTKSSQLADVNAAQQELLVRTQDLSALLDQRLLWLPSTDRVSLVWPRIVASGAAEVLTPRNFIGAGTAFITSLKNHVWLTLATIILLILDFMMRPKLREQLAAMKDSVGRVQKDTLLNTPLAVFASVARVLPPCLIGLWAGYILYDSDADIFSIKLGHAIIFISALCLGLLTIKDWSRDGRLFDLHFKVKTFLRHRLSRNITWFLVTQSIALLLMTLCDGYESEQANAGLGLLGFLVGTVSLAVFIYRMLWSRRAHVERFVRHDSFIGRHHKTIFSLIFALPFFTSILAASGYFATALEVQIRIVLTAGLVILAYVLYGVVQRTVIVMQRRLALEQMKKRRQAMLKEREEREAAEERGETQKTMVPAVNYEQIDLENISRQSRQLLNIIVVIIVGTLAWVLWADLLPALSVFNDVKLPFDKLTTDIDGESRATAATLWDLMKAIFTAIITFAAAKNLPGFLDLFVLKRSGITAGSRYAITTVLGYIIIITGILIVSDQIGIEWGNLQWIIAALGVGIGFGLQEIIANFISGLIILFERPVRMGDYVTIGDQSGTITRIQIRATTLSDLDQREILIPNRELIAGRVTNWTLSNSTLRIIVRVGVAYGTDTDHAQKIMLDAVRKISSIMDSPEPQVLFLGFGDSSLDFEIRAFLGSVSARFPVMHEIHTEVNKALAKEGISIPFPQRDLHFINPAPAAAPAVKSAPKRKPKTTG